MTALLFVSVMLVISVLAGMGTYLIISATIGVLLGVAAFKLYKTRIEDKAMEMFLILTLVTGFGTCVWLTSKFADSFSYSIVIEIVSVIPLLIVMATGYLVCVSLVMNFTSPPLPE